MLSKLYLYIIHSIFLLFYKKEYKKYMRSRNILEIQENKLKEILESNKNSLYGKKYNFNEIKTIEDFQREVPLTTYEDYLAYIEKIKNGEEHVLTYEKVKMFELTSGSTSASKLIPYTDSLKKNFKLV
ncbi:GH3 auxin-responsive promoter family protein [Fusobacterium pseudoperiodonticum]|nr:GH3 auxin-responsive promoter family protein [Fusobacterium pseudoperiodonticum]